MATTSAKIDEHPISLHTDKIVRSLDLFPELVQALRDGDVLTGRLFCAQLFDCELTPTLQAAMKAH